jgi:hypothetical protein
VDERFGGSDFGERAAYFHGIAGWIQGLLKSAVESTSLASIKSSDPNGIRGHALGGGGAEISVMALGPYSSSDHKTAQIRSLRRNEEANDVSCYTSQVGKGVFGSRTTSHEPQAWT